MKTINMGHADKWRKCPICGDQIRTLEECWTIESSGNQVAAFCSHHSLEDVGSHHPDACHGDDDGERHLRSMEDFGAYRAAGATESYWDDHDAGYAS